MIRELEESTRKRLTERIIGIPIESFPNNPTEYRLLHPSAAVLVRYAGSNFTPSLSPNIIIQDRTIDFDITIIARSLTDNRGVYELIESIRVALTGFIPDGCTKMYPKKDEFVNENEGIWQYSMIFSTTRRVSEIEMQHHIIETDESNRYKDDINILD